VSLDVAVIVTLDLSGRLTILATHVSGLQDPDLYLGGNMKISDIFTYLLIYLITYLFHGAESFLRS
jgi:hypothetical protein